MTDSVQIVLADTKGPFARIIKWNTWSEWAHAALVIDDGRIMEATFQGGVHVSSLQSLKDRSRKGVILECPVKSAKDVIANAVSLLGLPYDTLGALGLGMHRNWQESDAFWCSEAVYYAIHKAGNRYFRAEAMSRITPQHLYMLDLPIVESW